jgi:hypothetical protein
MSTFGLRNRLSADRQARKPLSITKKIDFTPEFCKKYQRFVGWERQVDEACACPN